MAALAPKLEEDDPTAMGSSTLWTGTLALLCTRSFQRIMRALGHVSKFVQVGARRITSTEPFYVTKTVAILNPDRSSLLVILNDSGTTPSYQVHWFGFGMTRVVDVDAQRRTLLRFGQATTMSRASLILNTIFFVYGRPDSSTFHLSVAVSITG